MTREIERWQKYPNYAYYFYNPQNFRERARDNERDYRKRPAEESSTKKPEVPVKKVRFCDVFQKKKLLYRINALVYKFVLW